MVVQTSTGCIRKKTSFACDCFAYLASNAIFSEVLLGRISRVSISLEISLYFERMTVFGAGMYVVWESSNAIYRLVQRTIVNWTIVNCYDSIYPSRSLFFYAYRFVFVTDHVRSFYHVTARKGVRAKQGYRYRVIVNSALFRSSVNNEACKYAMWTPQQIAAVSTKAFHRTVPGIKDTEWTINRSSNVQSFLIDNLLLFPYLVSGN